MKKAITKFKQFINESWVDQEGELGDFEFNRQDHADADNYAELDEISDFLKDEGATGVKFDVEGDQVEFLFNYREFELLLQLDLESDECLLTTLDHSEKIYRGTGSEFFSTVGEVGLRQFLGYV
jgi:hypothetical protein